MKAHAKVHEIASYQPPPAQPLQGTLQGWLPRKESRLMSEEVLRTNGVFIPYPLLAIIIGLVLALGGGIIGMYVKLDTMNATMLMRDGDRADQLKKLEEKLDLANVYIHNLREAEVRREEREKNRRN